MNRLLCSILALLFLVSACSDEAGVEDENPCGPPGSTFARCALNPLYTAGSAHSDGRLELLIADPDVMFDAEEGLWKAWWQTPLDENYLEPNITQAILYAESRDGINWTVQDEPVLEAKRDPGDWDYDRVETPTVIKVNTNPPERRYVMYYSGGNFDVVNNPAADYPWYQVGMAFSSDGKSFQRLPANESPYYGQNTPFTNIEGLVLMGRDVFPNVAGMHDGLVADPEVIIIDGVWHLFFSSMPVDSNFEILDFGISHATSSDGVNWVPSDGNPLLAGMQPSVIWDPQRSQFEIFYNGDTDEEKAAAPSKFNPSVAISHATSPDGENIETTPDVFSWNSSYDYEEYGWLTGADVVLRPDGYWLYYTGFSSVNPPENFLVEARNDWCASAGETCTCFDDGGVEICVLPTVTTLNLARRMR